MHERLTPIPAPRAQLWKELRLQYLPVVVFVAGVIAAGFIWIRWVAPPTLVGEVEAVRTEVRAAVSGALDGLDVDVMQPVKAGQTIGNVIMNPRILEASIAVIRAEIELMRTTLDPVAGQQRIAVDLERLQLDWLTKRVELVTLQGRLHQAEATLARMTVMHQGQLVTDEQFEEARNTRNSLKAQVDAQTDLIRQLEPGMRNLYAGGPSAVAPASQGLAAAIRQKEEELRLVEAQLGPVPLVAPIDGVITHVFRRSGETVAAGEVIVQVSATRAERIIGYLRQPLPAEPKPGATVEVRTRSIQRRIGTATVTQVGQQLEPVSATLLAAMRLPVTATPTELGLRIHVSAPPELALRPGEQVDLILHD